MKQTLKHHDYQCQDKELVRERTPPNKSLHMTTVYYKNYNYLDDVVRCSYMHNYQTYNVCLLIADAIM